MNCFCLPLNISKQLPVSEIAANACYENTIDTDKLKGNSIQKRICEKQIKNEKMSISNKMTFIIDHWTALYGPEKTPYLDTFHALGFLETSRDTLRQCQDAELRITLWFRFSNSLFCYFI